MRSLLVLLVAAVVVTFVACKDDEETPSHGHDDFPACKELGKRCHAFDTGSGLGHDCHELGHGAKTEAECIAKRDECLAVCPLTDGGAEGGHVGDAGTD